jgi:hypothetical protein
MLNITIDLIDPNNNYQNTELFLKRIKKVFGWIKEYFQNLEVLEINLLLK